MSSIDDIWASMNEDYQRALPAKPKKSSSCSTGSKKSKSTGVESSVAAMLSGTETLSARNSSTHKDESKKKAKSKAISSEEKQPVTVTDTHTNTNTPTHTERVCVSFDVLLAKTHKHTHALSDEDALTRRRALTALHHTLCVEHSLTDERDYDALFHELCKPLFKRFSDNNEKCRELAHTLTRFFFSVCSDVVPVLGYYFPALLQRMPKDVSYDEELKVFVLDKETHAAYKRGKAVDREDKRIHADGSFASHVEPSEEIRLAALQALSTLVNRVQTLGSSAVLHPYFEEIILFTQSSLIDSNPETKILACETIERMARTQDFELGFKYYSVAFVRVLLPQLKHRQQKVRCAALTATHAVMTVPDRAKRKAAGSEAIVDLVGFREENVLPIAAFYKPDVTFNYLAEVVTDKAPAVRERLVAFLTSLLTEIEDRYDHQTRLLPYLLDLLTDEIESISQAALRCLQRCGKQYEEEHFEEILRKKQYSVDGDTRINLDKPLPAPFTQSGRPAIGVRLYVRSNSKRFVHALVNELTNWVAQTRIKSAELMKMVVVLCEEHLTMDVHTLLPALLKALKFAREDGDTMLQKALLEVNELLGRYLLPEIYLYYLLPRLRGDSDVVAFGLDNDTRINALLFLQSLLSGSKASQIVPHFDEIISTLTDVSLLNYVDSVRLSAAILDILETLVVHTITRGNGNTSAQHVIEAFYLQTGRLSSLQITVRKVFSFLLSVSCAHVSLQEKTVSILRALSTINGGNNGENEALMRLFQTHTGVVFRDILCTQYDVDFFRTAHVMHTHTNSTASIAINSTTSNANGSVNNVINSVECAMVEHQLLLRLFLTPWYTVHTQDSLLHEFFVFLRKILTEDVRELEGIVECENMLFSAANELFLAIAMPVYLRALPVRREHVEFFRLLDKAVKGGNDDEDNNDANKKAHAHSHSSSAMQLIAGMSERASHAAHQQAVQTMNAHCAEVLELLVYNHRWSKSVSLAAVRLRALAVLCGHFEEVCASETDSDEDESEGEGVDLAFPLTASADMLIAQLPSLVSAVLPSALSPAVPRVLRMSTVRLFRALVQDLKRLAQLEKLRSFAKARESERATHTESMSVSVSVAAKLAAQSLIQSLLAAIQDSDDDVRVLIVHTIADCAPLFLCEETVRECVERRAVARASECVSFRAAVSVLLRELFVELQLTSSSAIVDALDFALRSLCVCGAVLFEDIVREESDASGGMSANAQKRDFVNDLIGHADLISSLP